MSEGVLTDRIRNFVEHYVFAVEHLEVMLLLEAAPEATFTADEVYGKILSSRGSITAWLETMVAHGLAVKSSSGQGAPTYQFAPSTPELREYMQDLAQVYRAYPVRVIEVIYHPGRRQQAPQDPAQSFANAFKFRQHT
ncbi:hypothetical protein [Verrucomicrobium sp. BvORR106]|uniref:hypothetical protein n=1 Tax=Verrucomicrobium sp. BvORR106 TaxID=1403819 RepID=UPI00056DDE9F|nr:hypothetical protein [Verrucomicrobium sp. BvORR106]